jgi:hypothetical protein
MTEPKKEEKDMFETMELQASEDSRLGIRVGPKDVIVDEGVPSMLSPQWHEYVMSLFDESEKIDGNPLVAGLRRVSELVLGPIVFSGPTQVFPVQETDHHGRATVVFTVEFESGMRYSEVADVWEGNTDDMFCAYAVATASTRAEGRALRKALKIKGVAAEEITKKNTAEIVRTASHASSGASRDGDYNEEARMSDAQYNFIDVKCKQLDVSGADLFKQIFEVEHSRKVSKKIASDIIDTLNEYQRDKASIPELIIGYNEEWRS